MLGIFLQMSLRLDLNNFAMTSSHLIQKSKIFIQNISKSISNDLRRRKARNWHCQFILIILVFVCIDTIFGMILFLAQILNLRRTH